MVRFVHAAPNAAVDHVILTSEQDEAGGVAVDGFSVGYAEMSDYVALPAGTYDVSVILEPVEGEELARVVPTESLEATGGEYYTVALMGLVIPQQVDGDRDDAEEAAQEEGEQEDAEQEEAEEREEAAEDPERAAVADPTADPFMAWLQGLFADETVDRGDLDLQVLVLDDQATEAIEEDEMRVRVVHAAPGTEPVALTAIRADVDDDVNDNDVNDNENDNEVNDDERVEIVETVEFGEASQYVSLRAGDAVQVRTEDGEAVILDLTLDVGMLHTVFVTGTPVEPVPIEAVVASTRPLEVEEPEEEEPVAEVDEEVAEEPVAVAEPAEPDPENDVAEYAMVRFVHAAPNADIEQVLLIGEDDAIGGIMIEDFADVAYADMSDYVAIPAGSYQVNVVLEALENGEEAAAEEAAEAELARVVEGDTFTASEGQYYTVTLMGLVIPRDVAEPEERADDPVEDGFLAWLEGLFAADEPERDELDLRVVVLDDEATTEVAEDEIHVRVVHAAPGTEPVSLAVRENDDDVDLVQTVGYGEAGGFTTVEAGQNLELRTEDGEAVILDLADLQPGMLHTVFVTGTPVEEVPIEAVVASTQPVVEEESDDGAWRPGGTEMMAAAAN